MLRLSLRVQVSSANSIYMAQPEFLGGDPSVPRAQALSRLEVTPEETQQYTSMMGNIAMAGGGAAFPLIGGILATYELGSIARKLMQGEELNAADYVALGAPVGGAAASSILKRAIPALKALKGAGRTKEAIKLEQEIAGDIAQALNGPAGIPKAPGSRFASGAGPDLRTSTRAGSEVADDLNTVVGLRQARQSRRAPDVEPLTPDTRILGTEATRPGLGLAPPPARLPAGSAPQRSIDLPLDEQRTAPNFRLLEQPRPRFDTEEFFSEFPTDSVYVGPMRNKSIADVPNVEFFTDARRAQRFPGGEIPASIPRTGEPGKVFRFDTNIDLGRAGIRDTQIYGGPPAGVPDTTIQTMKNIVGRGRTRVDAPTMSQAMYRPENVNMATSAGELVPRTGTRTSIGRLATGLDEGTMPGQLATRIDESTMPGRLATRRDTGTIPQAMYQPENVPVNLTPSSFVSGRSVPLREPRPRDPGPFGRRGLGQDGLGSQPRATPFNTDPVGQARPIPRAPGTDSVGQARRVPSAPRGTIAEEGLPAGIPDTIADGIPAALRRDPSFSERLAPPLAIAAAGSVGAAGLTAAMKDDDAVQASPITQLQARAAPRRVADASPGSYKLRSGDTVMDLVKTITSNKKRQEQILSDIIMLNPEILKEEVLTSKEGFSKAKPGMIDPSRVKAGDALQLPENVATKLKASETALASRRAANMKTRKKRASQKSDDISNFRNEVIDMRPADLNIEIPEDPIEAMSYDEKEAFDREYAGMGMAYGGKVPDMKGYMFGGSVGSTDTVPAMLTPGEHVIDRPNAEYIRQNPSDMRNLRRLARDIQDGVPSNPPVVQGYAAGGKVAKKTDPSKWEQAKRDAKAKMGGKHSARAMQLATQLYKKRGGGYKGSKPSGKSNSLKKWGEQKWKWSGGDKKGPGGKGVYLPSKKVDKLKSTAKGKMKLAVASAKKAKATREGKQYSKHGLASGVKGYEKGGKVLERIGVSGYNKPKRTPNHPTKSHVVVAKKGDTVKTIRFGQQGVRGAGKNPKSAKDKARKKSYYARHNAQDASPDKLSARYWSHKVKW